MGEDRLAKIVGLVRRECLVALRFPVIIRRPNGRWSLLPDRRMRWIEKAWKKQKLG